MNTYTLINPDGTRRTVHYKLQSDWKRQWKQMSKKQRKEWKARKRRPCLMFGMNTVSR